MISCDHCGMIFKYNCHLEKHLSRKFPCFTNIPTEIMILQMGNTTCHNNMDICHMIKGDCQYDKDNCHNIKENDKNICQNVKENHRYDVCLKTFSRKDSLDKHVGNGCKLLKDEVRTLELNLNKDVDYICDKCGKQLSSISYKKKHEAKCDGLNSLQCPTCHKWFSSASTKSEHRRNVKCSPPTPIPKTEEKPKVVRKKITPTVKLQVGASQSWRCNICHEQLKSTYHIDHIIQICRGGTNAEDNLQVLCVECHADKTQRERQV